MIGEEYIENRSRGHVIVERIVFGSLLLAVALGNAAAQNGNHEPLQIREHSPTAAQIHDLSLTNTVPFPIPPPSAMLSQAKCDRKGNIYLVESGAPPSLLTNGGLSSVPLMKLSIDSKGTTTFALPTVDRYRGTIRSDFDVDADGTVFALLEALDASPAENHSPPAYFIAKYHADGSVDSKVKLDVTSRHLQPFRLAAFANGNVLLTGTAAIEGEALHPFIAVFDKDGQFVANVRVKDVADPAATAAATEDERAESESDRSVELSSSSFMASGSDGNVYLVRDAAKPRIYVISPAGEVVRSFRVHAPLPNLTAINVALTSEGNLAVTFSHVEGVSAPVEKSDVPSQVISIVRSRTGEQIGAYRLPTDTAAATMPACALSSDTFLFLGSTEDRQHQLVAKYSLQK